MRELKICSVINYEGVEFFWILRNLTPPRYYIKKTNPKPQQFQFRRQSTIFLVKFQFKTLILIFNFCFSVLYFRFLIEFWLITKTKSSVPKENEGKIININGSSAGNPLPHSQDVHNPTGIHLLPNQTTWFGS